MVAKKQKQQGYGANTELPTGSSELIQEKQTQKKKQNNLKIITKEGTSPLFDMFYINIFIF